MATRIAIVPSSFGGLAAVQSSSADITKISGIVPKYWVQTVSGWKLNSQITARSQVLDSSLEISVSVVILTYSISTFGIL